MNGDATLERDLDLEESLGPEDTTAADPRASAEAPPGPSSTPLWQSPPASPCPAHSGVGGLSGLKKAAVFVLSLDEEVASALLRCLTDAELGQITSEIANLGVVDKEAVSSVIREFSKLERLHSMVREGGLENAMRLVERTFPGEKARRIGQLLASHRPQYPFSFLEEVEPETLLACLVDEHPQTLTVILAHMSPSSAAEIVERLPLSQRRDVLERIARLEGANTEALQSLELSLRKQIEAARFESFGESAGVKAAADILRAAAGGGTSILDDLREGRPDLAEEIGKHLFVFEDLAHVDGRALQVILKEVDSRRLALALKNAPDSLVEKVLNNLSRRAAEMLREEMSCLGPVRFVELEAARRAILEAALRLESSGQLYISGRGREENRLVY